MVLLHAVSFLQNNAHVNAHANAQAPHIKVSHIKVSHIKVSTTDKMTGYIINMS